MDPKLRAIIEKMQHYKKPDDIWNRGEPMSQRAFSFEAGTWRELSLQSKSTSESLSAFSVLSWNIDFMRVLETERMQVALDFVREYAENIPNPAFIMFNEMLVSDLDLIQAQLWVQEKYVLTDVSSEYWESGYYGTCILIPRSLAISKVFRVHYEVTAMERDALFVDITINDKTLRLCSTHLESLVAKTPKRPKQLAMAAKFMHEADASILGGDLNAIQPFDKTLHSENSLKDAYLVMGGKEDDESGMTWGQMAPTKERNKFGLSRMDKLFFCGAVEVDRFETFGMDVILNDAEKSKEMIEEEGIEKAWVTDHLGIRGDFHVVNGVGDANL